MDKEDRYDSLFRYYGDKYGTDWQFLKEQVRAESNFDPSAVSPVGAKGLAQFMDQTWLEWKDGTPGIQSAPPFEKFNQFDVEHSILAQAAMMAWLVKQFSVASIFERPKLALAAYNAGIGNITAAGKLAVTRGLPANKWVSIVAVLHDVTSDKSAAQTIGYVATIMKSYKDRYGKDATA